MLWWGLSWLFRMSMLCDPIFIFKNYVYTTMSMCGYEHLSTVASEARRGRQIPQELEFQEIVSCPAWMLGSERGSSVTARLLLRGLNLSPLVWSETA